ncbi:hypothetical protein C498_01980 [Haloferax volcanii DS2]|uniref:Uncharacterized protein n=1 Tax=Haloferax volcanii (strain ATCC 29605 / DSM 3757 / JCM 8879 / NBRC 14742 / NCIMB 2012 / VKM B-1768 / DS2) TaxID=309800 RepID=L9VIH8_HALVD|nr:hypothetical protein C498_01980 [Haloferax volcanii DS2]
MRARGGEAGRGLLDPRGRVEQRHRAGGGIGSVRFIDSLAVRRDSRDRRVAEESRRRVESTGRRLRSDARRPRGAARRVEQSVGVPSGRVREVVDDDADREVTEGRRLFVGCRGRPVRPLSGGRLPEVGDGGRAAVDASVGPPGVLYREFADWKPAFFDRRGDDVAPDRLAAEADDDRTRDVRVPGEADERPFGRVGGGPRTSLG